ncbi:NAD(P)/FAD-dependent oxidoreductase [Paraburkholderia acidiphila]|uniref:FAD-dependent oxidoreductase n=1 Tax=Paraburkholderia acidiphila TaxID=2571747 RepID=A0A7Z2G8B5_9BURK|nr:FAD-binding oxidoreductase [Paraburkholderia acidiphila]QGZ56875.1 FAD-dependent oxidoreductase [Paraburkholderia acidiphila]
MSIDSSEPTRSAQEASAEIHRPTRRKVIVGAASLTGMALAGVALRRLGRDGGIGEGKPRSRLVASSATVPSEVDVVVIGGGNVGCFTALELAERGLRVAICEKGVIAGEASGRSLGYIDGLMLDPVKIPLIARAKQLWTGVSARVGADVGYRQTGVAALFSSPDLLAEGASWVQAMKDVPASDARVLSQAQVAALVPEVSGRFAGAVYEATDGIAEPQLFASAVAEKVRQLGGSILQFCAVRGIETNGGKVSAVVTEKGRIGCDTVVLAGGVWSPVMARSLGLDLPQFMAFGSVARLSPTPGPKVSTLLADETIVMRRNIAGGYDICHGVGVAPLTPDIIRNLSRLRPAMQSMWDSLTPVINVPTFFELWRIPSQWRLDESSPFEKHRILAPDIARDESTLAVQRTKSAFPGLAAATVTENWSGILTSTPDNMPVISAVPTIPGMFVGSGFYYGLTMAPAAGEALADLVTGHTPRFDLMNYRMSRFSDGSPIVFRA